MTFDQKCRAAKLVVKHIWGYEFVGYQLSEDPEAGQWNGPAGVTINSYDLLANVYSWTGFGLTAETLVERRHFRMRTYAIQGLFERIQVADLIDADVHEAFQSVALDFLGIEWREEPVA